MKNKQKIQFTVRLQIIILSTSYFPHFHLIEKSDLQPVYSFLPKNAQNKTHLWLLMVPDLVEKYVESLILRRRNPHRGLYAQKNTVREPDKTPPSRSDTSA